MTAILTGVKEDLDMGLICISLIIMLGVSYTWVSTDYLYIFFGKNVCPESQKFEITYKYYILLKMTDSLQVTLQVTNSSLDVKVLSNYVNRNLCF